MLFALYALLGLMIFGRVCGQSQYAYYPVQFSQYMRHYPFINPASIGKSSKIETLLGSKNHLGNFSSISTNYAGAFIRINHADEKRRAFNVAGVRFDNDQEGRYISRTRAYACYAFHFNVFRDYWLSGGVDLGGLNMSVKGTPSTGDKSEFVPDANSGIWLYNEKTNLGISVNQIFNGRLQPYQEISLLRRHFNITAMHRFKLGNRSFIRPSMLFRFPSYINYNADYSLEFIIAGFTGGCSLRHKLGAAFWLGIEDLDLWKGQFDAVINYNTPARKSLVNVTSLEIVCSYGL
ncbi:MAG: type IX secretion system membrane protein PorP/SprF [Bacteroidales bacterium]|nr:type IX secretion system membrane protein PorP/SprF [Bacteroidales bacterium]